MVDAIRAVVDGSGSDDGDGNGGFLPLSWSYVQRQHRIEAGSVVAVIDAKEAGG